jgi:hypothetical protein
MHQLERLLMDRGVPPLSRFLSINLTTQSHLSPLVTSNYKNGVKRVTYQFHLRYSTFGGNVKCNGYQ